MTKGEYGKGYYGNQNYTETMIFFLMNIKLIICLASFCLNAIIHFAINVYSFLHNNLIIKFSPYCIEFIFRLLKVVKDYQKIFLFIITQTFSIEFESKDMVSNQ